MPENSRVQYWVLVTCLLMSLGGCADLQRRGEVGAESNSTDPQALRDLNLENILAFGADYARGDPASRLVQCHKQLQWYAQSRQVSGLVRLFLAQLGTESCGDLATTARVVRAMRSTVNDARLLEFLAFQLMIAEVKLAAVDERTRLSRRLDYARSSLKKALSNSRQAVSSSKQALSKQREAVSEREQAISQTREIYRQMMTRDAEARQLREKIDALKSIEQDVNDSER